MIWKVGRLHQKWLEILHADKTPGNLHPNSLQEMEVDIRNALGAFSKAQEVWKGQGNAVTGGRKPGTDQNFQSIADLVLENPKALYDTEAPTQNSPNCSESLALPSDRTHDLAG